MTPPRNNPPNCTTDVAQRNNNAEWVMASLVLMAVAMSILSSMAGFSDAEGKEKNGVRRAASQLERKIVKVPQLERILVRWNHSAAADLVRKHGS